MASDDLDKLAALLSGPQPKGGWRISDHAPDSDLMLHFDSFMDRPEDRAPWNALFAALPELLRLARDGLKWRKFQENLEKHWQVDYAIEELFEGIDDATVGDEGSGGDGE